MRVDSEKDRDPYWTNIGYYNSIRELGQAATWIRADIDQHLDVMYKRRFEDKRYPTKEEYRKNRRYIWRDEELTSRISGSEVTASLANLGIRYPGEVDSERKIKEHPIDICLATNMISVGLDVSRLGLMTVAGQPKTTSEYIQATSRVGRDAENAPGLVFVLYRPAVQGTSPTMNNSGPITPAYIATLNRQASHPSLLRARACFARNYGWNDAVGK